MRKICYCLWEMYPLMFLNKKRVENKNYDGD